MDVLLPVQPAHRGRRQGRNPTGGLPSRARCGDGCGRLLAAFGPQAFRRRRRAVAGRGGELARRPGAGECRQRADPGATRRQSLGHAVRTTELLRRQDLGTRAEASRGHHPAGSDGQRDAPCIPRPAHRPPRTRTGGDAGGRLRGCPFRTTPLRMPRRRQPSTRRRRVRWPTLRSNWWTRRSR